MWDFRCPQLAGRAGSLLPEQPNCQGNQTAPTLNGYVMVTECNQWLRSATNGYGVQPMCLVPFLHPSTPAEEHNNVHKRARVVIDRTFGQV